MYFNWNKIKDKYYTYKFINMAIGIIYKFTIVCGKVKRKDLPFPFYVGQHWEYISVDNFLSKKYSMRYWGSGIIWLNLLKKLRTFYPKNWQNFIHREVLYAKEDISQKALDALEAHFIKKCNAHHSLKLGGCNILLGTSYNWSSGNPSKDPIAKEKQRKSLINWWKNHPEERYKVSKRRKGVKLSEEQKVKISHSLIGKMAGDKNPMFGRKASDETRKKIRERWKINGHPRLGKKHSESSKRKISESRKKYVGEKHPLYGCHFVWITNGVDDKRHNAADVIPNGWKRGRSKF